MFQNNQKFAQEQPAFGRQPAFSSCVHEPLVRTMKKVCLVVEIHNTISIFKAVDIAEILRRFSDQKDGG